MSTGIRVFTVVLRIPLIPTLPGAHCDSSLLGSINLWLPRCMSPSGSTSAVPESLLQGLQQLMGNVRSAQGMWDFYRVRV